MLKENSSIEMKKGENAIRQEKVNGLEFDFNAGCKKSLKVFTFYKWTSVCNLVKLGAINMSLNEMIMWCLFIEQIIVWYTKHSYVSENGPACFTSRGWTVFVI